MKGDQGGSWNEGLREKTKAVLFGYQGGRVELG